MSIQNRIDSLQPYVVQIRFVNGVAVVDAYFKKGWKVPSSKIVEAINSSDDESYYMFYSEKEGVVLDDILDFIDEVIRINIEREKKYELLKDKIEELKELFKKTPYNKLLKMKFVLGDDKLVPDNIPMDFDDDIEMNLSIESAINGKLKSKDKNNTLKGESDNHTEEDIEIKNNGAGVEKNSEPIVEKKTESIVTKVGNQNIELPPKGKKIEIESYEEPNIVCKCGPDDMCPVCIEEKTSV